MRTRSLTLISLSTAALLAAALPASATTAQTAKDLAVARGAVPGFKQVVKPGLKKGPITATNSCGQHAVAPAGVTVSTEEFERAGAVSADKTSAQVDQLQLTTFLAPSDKVAEAIVAGLVRDDAACPTQMVSSQIGKASVTVNALITTSAAGRIKHADAGFLETTTFGGMATVNGATAPISGSTQALVYPRGRAVTVVAYNSVLVHQSADDKTLLSVEHLHSDATKATLTKYAKVAVARTGVQVP